MEITRRDFIKCSLLLGSSLFVSPGALYAEQKKRDLWHPAYEELEKKANWLRESNRPIAFSRIVACVHESAE